MSFIDVRDSNPVCSHSGVVDSPQVINPVGVDASPNVIGTDGTGPSQVATVSSSGSTSPGQIKFGDITVMTTDNLEEKRVWDKVYRTIVFTVKNHRKNYRSMLSPKIEKTMLI